MYDYIQISFETRKCILTILNQFLLNTNIAIAL